jgi:hypothetical protein
MPRKSLKCRAPDDFRQTGLRMRQHEHSWLTEEAKTHRTTLNAEIMWRVMRTREDDSAMMVSQLAQDAHSALATLGDDLQTRLRPYLIDARERDHYSDVVFAARRIVDENSAWLAAGQIQGRTAERLRAMLDDFHLARRDLELAFGEKAISQGTPGFRARMEERRKQAASEAPRDEEPDQ